ncbi:hypothetical protein Y1Q_0007895 [Alligator mississippiensis]|uniref:Uncharacterized protein n=1 Tax=Alligator mississippiensis TaxID=8496 RepID=A0A151NF67_ALLMI|nr:hypothetical protein Y1Q_0007895 [Alligator mississippiensis]
MGAWKGTSNSCESCILHSTSLSSAVVLSCHGNHNQEGDVVSCGPFHTEVVMPDIQLKSGALKNDSFCSIAQKILAIITNLYIH